MARQAGSPFYLNLWYTGDAAMRRATPANTTVRTRGMAVILQDGSAVEDWGGQFYVNNIGTGRPELARALAAQTRRMSWVAPSTFADVRLALTRDLLGILPRHLTTPQFSVSGSDAGENALRAARRATGRQRVLTLSQAYHGDTMVIENICGTPLTPYGDRRPWAVKTPSPFDLWERAGRDWARAGDLALERAEGTLRRLGPRTFAAVVVEPVMCGVGAVPLSRRMARGLRGLCDRHGIKLIADEVVTGFGRTGSWFGSQTVGLVPDAVVCAKGLTGGYAPLGAVVFERSWGEDLRRHGFNHGLTFAGHPVGCAAARATIRILKRERLVQRSAALGRRLRSGLERLRALHPGRIADVRGSGLMVGLQLEPGRVNGSRRPLRSGAQVVERLCAAALRSGLQLLPTSDGTGLLFTPPFIVTARQIDRLLGVLDRALARS
jgi:adenosylmethionine-8-amino-7-oxononanoate aminotransferase